MPGMTAALIYLGATGDADQIRSVNNETDLDLGFFFFHNEEHISASEMMKI
jgi:hypothetical protein